MKDENVHIAMQLNQIEMFKDVFFRPASIKYIFKTAKRNAKERSYYKIGVFVTITISVTQVSLIILHIKGNQLRATNDEI